MPRHTHLDGYWREGHQLRLLERTLLPLSNCLQGLLGQRELHGERVIFLLLLQGTMEQQGARLPRARITAARLALAGGTCVCCACGCVHGCVYAFACTHLCTC